MRPHSRSTDYSRSSRRKSEKDANTAMTASLEKSMRIEELEAQVADLTKQLDEYKERYLQSSGRSSADINMVLRLW